MKFFSLSSYRAIRYSLTTSKFISLQSVRHLEPHSIDGLPFKPVNYSSQSCRKLTIIRYNGGDGATGGTAEGGGPGRSSEGVLRLACLWKINGKGPADGLLTAGWRGTSWRGTAAGNIYRRG